MRRIGLVAIGSACLCLAAATTSSADPIIVTAGSFIQAGHQVDFFVLGGDGFHFEFGAEFTSGMREQCSPCTASAGRPLTFGASTGGDFLSGNPGTFNGVSYATTFFSGGFLFTGPTVSSALLSPSNLTLTAPFSMTGSLTDFTSPDRRNPVFATALTGSGTATAQFIFVPGQGDISGPEFDVQSVTFAFESPAATPEPASILLFCTGLCLAGLRRRESSR